MAPWSIPSDPTQNRSMGSIDLENQTAGNQQPQRDVSAFKALSFLDRYLAVCILLATIIGILLGNFVPDTGPALQKGKFIGVSIPIAVGLLVLMYPILCKVRYESLHEVLSHRAIWKQICFSIFVDWVIAPFLMLALAWALLPDKSDLRVGLILVGLGRCIAMVLIWNGLAGGDSEYCAILVAINSLLQMVLGENGTVDVSYQVVATSVAVFLGIPLAAAIVTRFALRATAGPAWYERVFLRFASPWALVGLLYTVLVLFASQGRQVVQQIVSVVRVAAPLVVYFIVIFCITLYVARSLGFSYSRSTTQSFTTASNNFELAIAVAVATFAPQSNQALAATVGPLIEVPVLLGLVYVVRWMANRWAWK
ncbi:sodium bile acid symporter family-domain-containing protein [Truncatella angustata]|uniref:Sodium bile acid symporter family-domain-containing protein n=1 Tax=Truncatella angustata TaxID=152316 RepID=A0A9P8ZYN0_9PEZI|nr:sodium bile acid symporter family-domain-containing protein [Truncatella angustata]KAH6654200.1 sodium bile acid symporter family-domain-containing protein [Truncatella angustata]